MTQPQKRNRIRDLRTNLGFTQAQLAARAGVSRTAITAIEGNQLVPSVAIALAVAQALGTSVEQLFGKEDVTVPREVWAAEPRDRSAPSWSAEILGRTVRYPASSLPMLTPVPDIRTGEPRAKPEETLTLACCDPAAGLLASQFASITGMRLLVISRSSRQSLELLRNGLVHMAGIHFSSPDDPDANSRIVRETLGPDYELIHLARWQEGIAMPPGRKLRSLRAIRQTKLKWIGRESGSGARQCQDKLLEGRQTPRWTARHHRGVAEAVSSGWADVGVCVHLVSAEAGLDFLPVQLESYEVCVPSALLDDRRVKAFLGVVRSPPYRQLIAELPGYDSSETGNLWNIG